MQVNIPTVESPIWLVTWGVKELENYLDCFACGDNCRTYFCFFMNYSANIRSLLCKEDGLELILTWNVAVNCFSGSWSKSFSSKNSSNSKRLLWQEQSDKTKALLFIVFTKTVVCTYTESDSSRKTNYCNCESQGKTRRDDTNPGWAQGGTINWQHVNVLLFFSTLWSLMFFYKPASMSNFHFLKSRY